MKTRVDLYQNSLQFLDAGLIKIPNFQFRLPYSSMKPDSFLITKDQQSNSSNQCCKLWNTTTQAEGHSQQHGKELPAEIRTVKQNSLQKNRQLWETHREHCTNFTTQQWCQSTTKNAHTYSRESTPPASMWRWLRVVMEVVRWRLAWSSCLISRVISFT